MGGNPSADFQQQAKMLTEAISKRTHVDMGGKFKSSRGERIILLAMGKDFD